MDGCCCVLGGDGRRRREVSTRTQMLQLSCSTWTSYRGASFTAKDYGAALAGAGVQHLGGDEVSLEVVFLSGLEKVCWGSWSAGGAYVRAVRADVEGCVAGEFACSAVPAAILKEFMPRMARI